MSNEKINYIVDITGNIDKKLESIIEHQKKVNEEFDKIRTKAKTVEGGSRFDTMKSGLSSVRNVALGVAAAIGGVGYAMISLARQNAGLEQNNRAMMIASGSTDDYLKNLELLNTMQRKFGANIEASRHGLMSFSASTKGTALQGDKTRKIFQAVTQASGALGLSADRQGLVFMALSQMASKGTVSMEELRGQLGENLPGALNVAAKAMNMTSAEFQKLVGEGKVMATDFLPKFADELQKTFSGGFDPDSMTNVLTKWDNAWKTMAETAGGYFKSAISSVTDFLDEKANQLKKSASISEATSAIDAYNLDLSTFGKNQVVDKYKSDYYKQKYGYEMTAGGNPKLEATIIRKDVLPKYEQAIESQKSLIDNAQKGYAEAYRKQNWDDVFDFKRDYEVRLKELVEMQNQQRNLKKLYLSGEGTTQAKSTTVETKKIDEKFGGTTITARAPQTFNITINELIGIQELNNVTDSKEIGRQSGNVILDELMKAVAQVQMVQEK